MVFHLNLAKKGSLSSIHGLFLYPALLFLLFSFDHSRATEVPESKVKKDQIKQIETDLLREKEQFFKFGTKEKGLLRKLAEIEKEIIKCR